MSETELEAARREADQAKKQVELKDEYIRRVSAREREAQAETKKLKKQPTQRRAPQRATLRCWRTVAKLRDSQC